MPVYIAFGKNSSHTSSRGRADCSVVQPTRREAARGHSQSPTSTSRLPFNPQQLPNGSRPVSSHPRHRNSSTQTSMVQSNRARIEDCVARLLVAGVHVNIDIARHRVLTTRLSVSMPFTLIPLAPTIPPLAVTLFSPTSPVQETPPSAVVPLPKHFCHQYRGGGL